MALLQHTYDIDEKQFSAFLNTQHYSLCEYKKLFCVFDLYLDGLMASTAMIQQQFD